MLGVCFLEISSSIFLYHFYFTDFPFLWGPVVVPVVFAYDTPDVFPPVSFSSSASDVSLSLPFLFTFCLARLLFPGRPFTFLLLVFTPFLSLHVFPWCVTVFLLPPTRDDTLLYYLTCLSPFHSFPVFFFRLLGLVVILFLSVRARLLYSPSLGFP